MATSYAKRHKGSARKQDKTIVIGVVFVLLLVAAIAVAIYSDNKGQVAAEDLAPNFVLPGLDGEVALTDYRGQIVLVNFWASWCPPCKAEMPDLEAYYRQYKDQGFTVLAINMGESMDIAQGYIEATGFSFPVALDASGAVYNRYGAEALPSSYIIGRRGELIKAYPAGMITRAHLDRDVTPLLQG